MKIATISVGYCSSYFPDNTPQLVKTTSHHENPLCLIETMTTINEQYKRAKLRTAATGGDLRNIDEAGNVTGHDFDYPIVGQAV
ncbi:hypothetical protein [Pannonibacter indicus]|uniref:hypothetical protein n=1 Tax=Pannonibacter indicus TaxID=466044 RepID=UPI0035B042C3